MHYHATDSVLTSGCSFISQHIRNEMYIAITGLGTCTTISNLSVGKWGKYIHISGWLTFIMRTLSSLIVTCWHRWHSGWRWRPFWSRLSVCVLWRCTHSLAPPACLPIHSSACLARKEAVHLILTRHSRVSFYRGRHISMPRKFSAPHSPISDFSVRILDQALHFLHSGTQKPSAGHFGHIQGKAHVGLFHQHTTFLPCHCSRHVENLQEVSCWF